MSFDRQKTFDKAYKGVLAQGCASTEEGVCVYRGHKPDGKVVKCNLGQLFPDRVYDLEMENHGVGAMELVPVLKYLKVDAKPGSSDRKFLADLQLAHDNANDDDAGDGGSGYPTFIEAYKARMAQFATNCGLKVPT